MDLPSLAVILQAALSPDPHERKAAEESLNQYQFTPQHLVRLLQIIVDGNCDLAVRQVASIHFKNFIGKNWAPHEPGEQQKISPADKAAVRENLLQFIARVPPLLRVQFAECLKTIINADYPEQWPSLLTWVKHNLQDQQVYAALYVLRILSRKYEFKSEDERTPVYLIIDEAFPPLLNIFNRLVQVVNPTLEIAELIKLICKIFWSSIYLEVPKQLFDPNVFNAWMVLFLAMLERPVPAEGQPTDPEQRKSWEWWKVKKWTVHIMNRLYTRFGDPKLLKPENKPFAQMFQKHFAGKILECHLNLLNVIRQGGYLPDRVTNLILQYLSSSISKSNTYQLLKPQLDIVLFEIIFPLMCFNDNDEKLWREDPHEYVRKGYDIIEDLYSPRTASIDFIAELVRKRGKENLQRFLSFVGKIFGSYDEAAAGYKPYRQKDGALLAIGALCDKLKQTEPYKSQLEQMLVQHVFPEFRSQVGHLRAKMFIQHIDSLQYMVVILSVQLSQSARFVKGSSYSNGVHGVFVTSGKFFPFLNNIESTFDAIENPMNQLHGSLSLVVQINILHRGRGDVVLGGSLCNIARLLDIVCVHHGSLHNMDQFHATILKMNLGFISKFSPFLNNIESTFDAIKDPMNQFGGSLSSMVQINILHRGKGDVVLSGSLRNIARLLDIVCVHH
ncbi:hypothetical protein KI387_008901, partial [Taxus chinensis]